MLVRSGMIVAFGRAKPADERAKIEKLGNQPLIGFGGAGHDAPDGRAQIGTVQSESDTLAQRCNVLLCEACIGAGRASLCAGIA
jgi:hypothetical protein